MLVRKIKITFPFLNPIIIKAIETYKIEIISTLILGIVVSFYLYLPPQIGLADSADFSRIFSRLGLERLNRGNHDQFFNFFNSDYKVVRAPKVPVNIGQVPGLISLWINNIFQPEPKYSIFYLSVIYFLLYLTGYFFLLRNLFKLFGDNFIIKIITAAISFIIFSDILFVSYFNSFYQEALFLVAGVFVIAFAFKQNLNYNLLVVALIVLSLSKPQNIIFLLFPIYFIFFHFKQINKVILASSILMISFFLFFILKEQEQTNKPNLYEAFFLGVLHQAEPWERREIIKSLNFKEAGYLKNVSQVYWRTSNEFRNEKSKIYKEFYSNIDQIKIIQIYWLRPHLLIRNFKSGIKILQNNNSQPEHLGNYSKRDSIGDRVTVVNSFWGKYLNNLLLPIYFSGFIILIISVYKKNINRLAQVIFILLITIPVIFSANIVAGGINDFVKHNFSVYFMISLLFILTLIQLKIFFSGNNSTNFQLFHCQSTS